MKNKPKGATHKSGKTYFKAVDFEHGSFDWWNGYQWVTKRSYPPKNTRSIATI